MRNKKKFISFEKLRKEWMKDPEFRRACEDLEPEYQIARQIIGARIKKGISHEEISRKASVSLATIYRLEGMEANPSLTLLKRVAQALGTELKITVR